MEDFEIVMGGPSDWAVAKALQPRLPRGFVVAPSYRGYALLGTGRYVLNYSAAPADPDLGAELIISLASEQERHGRKVGERRMPAEPGKPIQPEEMAVRIGFLTEAGLCALEDQLIHLRAEHFPGTVPLARRPDDALALFRSGGKPADGADSEGGEL